jgi:nucleoside-diphosphate-sugar epimerase
LVSVGTCESYGDHLAPFSETLEARPVSPYSALKSAASQWVLSLAAQEGLRATVARPFLTYGPGQPEGRLVPIAVARAIAGSPLEMTDGRQTREFNFVEDVARGLCAAAADVAVGRIVNIGGGPEIAVADLARKVFSMAGADPNLVRTSVHARRAGEVDRFVGEHSLARTLLGHTPRVSLDAGLQATIDAARAM